MNRGGKLVVVSVVVLFMVAGMYYAFFAPSPTDTTDYTLNEPLPEAPVVKPTVEPSITATLPAPPSSNVFSNANANKPTLPSIDAPPVAAGATPGPAIAAANSAPAVATLPTPVIPKAAPIIASPAPRAANTSPTITTAATDYTVKSGDTLSSIAANYFGSAKQWQAIAKANPGMDPVKLAVGQKIRLPAKGTANPASASAAGLQPATVGASRTAAVGEYTIRSGDTLSSIAARYLGKTSAWKEVYELNKTAIGANPAALKVGMKLRLPGKAIAADVPEVPVLPAVSPTLIPGPVGAVPVIAPPVAVPATPVLPANSPVLVPPSGN